MVAVIIYKIVKLLCMVALAWRIDTSPLVTLGDAVASFLDSSGEYTANEYEISLSQALLSAVKRVKLLPKALIHHLSQSNTQCRNANFHCGRPNNSEELFSL